MALLAIIVCSSNNLVEVPAAALPATASVTHVIDGDSYVAHFADGVDRGVRLIGVNAPELTDERENVRYWAFLAKRFAVHHLEGRKIKLEYDWNNLDKYGRVLAYVRPRGGELFNELIIRRGFAYIFLLYPFRKDYQESFRSAQQEAVRQGRGLWGKESPAVVGLPDIRNRMGEYVTVRFSCARVREGRGYVFLGSAEAELEVLISRESGLDLDPVSQFKSRMIVVSGILEKNGKCPRIYVLFKRQFQAG